MKILLDGITRDESYLTAVQLLRQAWKKDGEDYDLARTCLLNVLEGSDDDGTILEKVRLLVNGLGVDPFEDFPDKGYSAFQWVASQRNHHGLLKFFLRDVWDARYRPGNPNENGDFPLHLACCDPDLHVTPLQHILNHNPDALGVPDREIGWFPVHLAAGWNASLDVVYTLLRRLPRVLGPRLTYEDNSVGCADKRSLTNWSTFCSKLKPSSKREQADDPQGGKPPAKKICRPVCPSDDDDDSDSSDDAF